MNEDETFRNSDGQELYKATGLPVWRHRNIALPYAEYWELPFSQNPYVLLLLDDLSKLEKQTRPSEGTSTSDGKDLAAVHALQVAGTLIHYVAGWAIDHHVGLAIEGLRSVSPILEMNKNEHYLRQKAIVDDHKHEKFGVLRGERKAREEKKPIRSS
jgi:hypothetical protein